MHHRAFRRAAVAAFSLLVAASVFAFADTVPADGDSIAPGNQTLVDLGHASPGDVLAVQVTFSLVCIGASHATAGSTIALTYDSAIVPGDGAAEATYTTISVPQVWDPAGCPVPARTVPANAPSNVSITMPTTPGDNQDFTLMWARSGSGGLSGSTTLTFRGDAIGNTPPTIHVPNDRVVEATSAAGAVVTYSATATDAEDTAAPAVNCKPASGATFPIGMTTVQCSTKDSGGLTDTGSFLVTVVDTTAPVFANIADIDVTTGDPAGAVVDYGNPAVVEAVDPAPVFGCAPASGSVFAVGSTTVTCTAQDATGNQSSMSF